VQQSVFSSKAKSRERLFKFSFDIFVMICNHSFWTIASNSLFLIFHCHSATLLSCLLSEFCLWIFSDLDQSDIFVHWIPFFRIFENSKSMSNVDDHNSMKIKRHVLNRPGDRANQLNIG
jgi:hypothetical protein